MQPTSFPAVFFLDYAVFIHAKLEIPTANIRLPSFTTDFVVDVKEVAAQYFSGVHSWMPIISKQQFYQNLLNPLSAPRADLALLICCMKLVSWSPSEFSNEKDPKTTAYLTVKRSLLEAEVTGVLTIQLLQAWLLVSIYEIGHGIFPSGYISISTCARYRALLGINASNASNATEVYSLMDQEERRRVWWAITIMDRLDLSPFRCFEIHLFIYPFSWHMLLLPNATSRTTAV